MLDMTYTTIHGDADSMFNHSPGMDPKFDQFFILGPTGAPFETGVSVRQGEDRCVATHSIPPNPDARDMAC
jgi:hypothetical protein